MKAMSLVLLDVMMPKLNGLDTLKEIRKVSNVPVMMLTARGEDIDRVLGLELGADDYLPKPFNDRELIARIKAILRRSVLLKTENGESTKNSENANSVISFHGIELHPISQRAIYQGKDLNLTSTEFLLFYQLIQSPMVAQPEMNSVRKYWASLLPPLTVPLICICQIYVKNSLSERMIYLGLEPYVDVDIF